MEPVSRYEIKRGPEPRYTASRMVNQLDGLVLLKIAYEMRDVNRKTVSLSLVHPEW